MRSPSLSSGNVEVGAMRSDEQGVECKGTCDDEGDWAGTETNSQLRRQRVLSSNDSRNGIKVPLRSGERFLCDTRPSGG